jgi:excisionase family DNA binding protein
LSKIIDLAFHALAANGSVSVATLPEELTSNTAADVLGVSRPTLLKMAKDEQIPSFKVGTHRRFKRDDVLAFKSQREQSRRTAMQELLDIEDQLEG